MHIQTLTSLASLLLAALSSAAAEGTGSSALQPPARLQTVNDFLFSAGLDNINLFRLIRLAAGMSSQGGTVFHACLSCWVIANIQQVLSAAVLLGRQEATATLHCRYVKESKVLVKVAGYADASQAADGKGALVDNGSGPDQEGAL